MTGLKQFADVYQVEKYIFRDIPFLEEMECLIFLPYLKADSPDKRIKIFCDFDKDIPVYCIQI